MSDFTPPGDAGGPADRPPGPLTPAAIDAVLADFRRWLEDLAAAPNPPVADAPGSPGVDLATVVGAFTALRHEVNLQTKATRAQSEQLAEALDLLGQPAAAADDDDATRPFVKALAEVFDTLTRTTGEIDRLRENLTESPSGWRRLFGQRAVNPPTVSPPQLRDSG